MRLVRPRIRRGSVWNQASIFLVRRFRPSVRRTSPHARANPPTTTTTHLPPSIRDRISAESLGGGVSIRPEFRTLIDLRLNVFGGVYRTPCSIRSQLWASLRWPPDGTGPVIDPTHPPK